MKIRYVIVAALAALMTMSCGSDKTTSYQTVIRPVRVEKAQALGSSERIYSGVVEAQEYSNLAFKVMGPLIQMNVDAGEKVQKGKVIAQVDPLDYRLNFEATKANYITAKSQLERSKNLLAMQAISRQEYEIAEAKYVQAKSAFETAENTLKETKLVAPFSGFVEVKYVENYQKVQVGEPIIKLVNPNKLEIEFVLPETSVALTREVTGIKVQFDTYKNMWFDAKIRDIVDASPDGSGIPVKLEINDPRFNREQFEIYPGFSCKVQLTTPGTQTGGFVLPLSAVFNDVETGDNCVWVLNEATQTVSKAVVKTGALVGDAGISVLEGINENDQVVIAGVNYITEGQKVSVLK